MADVHLPNTLPRVFPDLPRRIELEAGTVDEVIDQLDQRWPGMRDRLCRREARFGRTSTSTSTRSGC